MPLEPKPQRGPATVLEGTPEHRDLYLTPDQQAAGDQFTPCCSRAKSARLLLDL
jgi:vanillate monooxygenase ferredoxin subunit